MTVAVASCYASAPAWALNEADLKAVVGSFTASQTGNVNVLTLTTSTNRTLVEAQQRFNIQANEQLRVLQPSSSSLFLLRVVPGQSGVLERSVIDGSIYSNGQFWLQNAAGALISKGAVIDTAGFLATNMAVRMEDFMAARLTSLQNIGGSGGIVNQGEIKTSSGGSVYLIGDNVKNEGIITTPGGETILAAGQTVSLVDTGTPGIKVEITGAAGDVTNLGEIVATAGRIGMAGVIVKNSGTLNASSVVSEGGRIFLKASKDAYVDGAGRIVATGTKGGNVEVLGERVAVMDQAQIDASGANGGGTVLVGGDYQGKNPDIQNATVTYFGRDASIKADATDNGDGGKVIVWADDTTRAYGTISARGGANGGNGGFVETSGHRVLDFGAQVNTSAQRGKTGKLLLDPSNVEIVAGTTADYYGGSFDGNNIFANSTSNSTKIGWSNIQTLLNSNWVTITTTGTGGGNGDITISGSPGLYDIQTSHIGSYTTSNTWYGAGYSSGNGLTLLAHGSVNINAVFGNYGSGNIYITSGWNGSTASPDTVAYGSGIGKNIVINGGGGIVSNGGVLLFSPDEIKLAASAAGSAIIDMGTGTLSMRVDNKISLSAYGVATNVGNQALIRTNGSQTYTLRGGAGAGNGLYLQGSNVAGAYGGYVAIESFGSGSQMFDMQNNGTVDIRGGSGNGFIPAGSWSGDCGTGSCSGNSASIENQGSGNQTFAFTGGGTLNLYGGSGGNSNSARIENKGTGTQTISGGASISLYGGTSGGSTIVYGGKVEELDNAASIESKTGTQTINAASLYMSGGTAAYGGAFLTAPTQNITLSGALTMEGGSLGGHGSAPAANDVYGDAIWYNPVVMGNDSANTVNLTVGSLSMAGGVSSNYGGSAALIGGYRVSTSVTVDSTGNIALTGANAGDDRIGSFGGYGGTVSLKSTGGGISLSKAYVGTGSTGTTTLRAYGGHITQDVLGIIETGTLSAVTTQAARDVTLSGANKVSYFSAAALRDVSFTNVISGHVSSITAGNDIAVVADDAAGTATISLGTLTSTAGNISVTADGQILDDNGIGTANLTGRNAISLSSVYGSSTASGIAISADVNLQSGGTPTISASVTGIATYGGINIRNNSSIAPGTVTLADHSTYAGSGSVVYSSAYDIDMSAATFSLSSDYGPVTISSDGFLTLGSPGEFSPGIFANSTYGYVKAWGQTGVATSANLGFATAIDLYVGSGASMTIGHNITNVRNVGLYAVGGLNLSSSLISASGNAYLGGAASALVGSVSALAGTASALAGAATSTTTYGGGAVTLTGATVDAGGTLYAYSGGDIRLNNGSSFYGGLGVNLGLGGTASSLYLNDTSSYASPSYILAGTGGIIKAAFPARSADGIVIDGATTMTSTAGGSGLFVGNHSTPAVKDSNLQIAYGVAGSAALNQAVSDVVSTITTTTTNATSAVSDSSTSSTSTANIPPPTSPTTGTSGGLASLSSGTVGGGAGQFGGSDTSSTTTTSTTSGTTTTTTSNSSTTSSGTTTDSTSSSSTPSSSSSTTSGETTQSSSSSGEQSNGSKDAKKEEKKDEKKDDSKKADSGEKKDDKASKKPVGKCSA